MANIADDISHAYQDGYNDGYNDGYQAGENGAVRHGRWYRFQKVYIDPQTGIGIGRDMYKCDACNVGEEETRKPYCPECGALMDKEDADGKTTD